VLMEVSSSALAQHRVDTLLFDAMIVTNLAQDHLDYHIDLQHYYEAKFSLLTKGKKNSVILMPSDCIMLNQWQQRISQKIYTYKKGDYPVTLIENNINHTSFIYENKQYDTSVVGSYIMENLNACLALFSLLQQPFTTEEIQRLQPVAGRLEKIIDSPYHVFIDYAHTAEALRNVLSFLRKQSAHRLAVVFGCGGNREKEKREQMGVIASQYADYIILTNDNPRKEDPLSIIRMIQKGTKGKEIIEMDRYQAIKKVLHWAQEDDIIIIAGKGDERVQWINNRKIPFHDKSVVLEILGKEG